jgi:hypothetical protein
VLGVLAISYTEPICFERFVEVICRIANKQARWIG